MIKRLCVVGFVALVLTLSYTNCLRTEKAIMDVEQFFIRARTVQAAQIAADRAMALVEQKTFEYADLKEAFKALVGDFNRLSFECESATIRATIMEQLATAQGEYITQLQKTLTDNKLPIPAPVLKEPTCPKQPGANSSNSPKPTSPPNLKEARSADGSCPRSSTELAVSGMVVLHVG